MIRRVLKIVLLILSATMLISCGRDKNVIEIDLLSYNIDFSNQDVSLIKEPNIKDKIEFLWEDEGKIIYGNYGWTKIATKEKTEELAGVVLNKVGNYFIERGKNENREDRYILDVKNNRRVYVGKREVLEIIDDNMAIVKNGENYQLLSIDFDNNKCVVLLDNKKSIAYQWNSIFRVYNIENNMIEFYDKKIRRVDLNDKEYILKVIDDKYLVASMIDGKVGIRKGEKFEVPMMYEQLYMGKNNWLAYDVDTKTYIDNKGNKYQNIQVVPSLNDILAYEKDGKFGIIDIDTMKFSQPKYEELVVWKNNKIIVSKDNGYLLTNVNDVMKNRVKGEVKEAIYPMGEAMIGLDRNGLSRFMTGKNTKEYINISRQDNIYYAEDANGRYDICDVNGKILKTLDRKQIYKAFVDSCIYQEDGKFIYFKYKK